MNETSKAAIIQLLQDPAGCSVSIMNDLVSYRRPDGKYVIQLFDPDDHPVYNSKLLPPTNPLYQEKSFDSAEEAVDFLCQVRHEVSMALAKKESKWQKRVEVAVGMNRRL